jgi:DNA gyrase subunit B
MNELEKVVTAQQEYNADNIQVLEGLEAVRKRPAMYIGDVSERGLHHLVYEVVDNSIDEALAGHCNHIQVTIHTDNSISVLDNGRGIPTGYHEKEKKSALEVVLTVLHAGGKFDKDSYKVSGGLHGVGVSCVNALSKEFKAEVYRDGIHYVQELAFGKPLYPVKELGPTDQRGTKIWFKPDDSIFTTNVYKYETLSTRLKELAYLNRGIRLDISDERVVNENGVILHDSFYSDEGLKDFIKYLDSGREKIMETPIYMEGDKDNVQVEVVMQYNTSFTENIQIFNKIFKSLIRVKRIMKYHSIFIYHSFIRDIETNTSVKVSQLFQTSGQSLIFVNVSSKDGVIRFKPNFGTSLISRA